MARQIRAQTTESRLAAMHDISEGFRSVTYNVVTNVELRNVVLKALEAVESLDDADRLIVLAYAQGFFRLWEEAFYLNADGRLDQRYWNGMNLQMVQFLSSPMLRFAWPRRREFYGTEFRAMVDALLENEARENTYSLD
jgi:hypothetical protein